jgi:hypothetical protein
VAAASGESVSGYVGAAVEGRLCDEGLRRLLDEDDQGLVPVSPEVRKAVRRASPARPRLWRAQAAARLVRIARLLGRRAAGFPSVTIRAL